MNKRMDVALVFFCPFLLARSSNTELFVFFVLLVFLTFWKITLVTLCQKKNKGKFSE